MDCTPPGSSVHGILQARILEWVAIVFSRRSSWPRGRTCVSGVSWVGRCILHHYHHLWEGTPQQSLKLSLATAFLQPPLQQHIKSWSTLAVTSLPLQLASQLTSLGILPPELYRAHFFPINNRLLVRSHSHSHCFILLFWVSSVRRCHSISLSWTTFPPPPSGLEIAFPLGFPPTSLANCSVSSFGSSSSVFLWGLFMPLVTTSIRGFDGLLFMCRWISSYITRLRTPLSWALLPSCELWNPNDFMGNHLCLPVAVWLWTSCLTSVCLVFLHPEVVMGATLSVVIVIMNSQLPVGHRLLQVTQRHSERDLPKSDSPSSPRVLWNLHLPRGSFPFDGWYHWSPQTSWTALLSSSL